jgi:glycosyltransferase involved in cell wall biosynthesis
VTALGAMAELPEGTVVPVRPGASPDEVADVLAALLDDAPLREELSRRAHAHAAANGFEAAAARLLGAIDLPLTDS